MAIQFPPGHDWLRDDILKLDTGPYRNDKGWLLMSPEFAALVLVQYLKSTWRYVPDTDDWYEFNGSRWIKSRSLYADIATALRGFKHRCQDPLAQIASLVKIDSPRFVPDTMKFLSHHSDMVANLCDFDQNKTLLNTPDGLLDLRTGHIMAQAAEHLCRNITSLGPLDDLDGKNCPNYMAHLESMTCGNRDQIEYLEAISGYFLTGETFLQSFYWFYGYAGNGKSTLANVWKYILNDYAHNAYGKQFTHTYNDPHPEQDKQLIGKRLVVVEEPPGKLDSSKVKTWTSGAQVAVRGMRENTINALPVCKFLFLSNLEPNIDPNDPGIVRRMKLFNFQSRREPTQWIPNFDTEVLGPEMPYILNRMIKAAQVLLTHKAISNSSKVTQDTLDFFGANNTVEQFINTACEIDATHTETSKMLYNAYRIFCGDSACDYLSPKKFAQTLQQMGFKHLRGTSGIYMRKGIKVNSYYSRKAGDYSRAEDN